MAITAQQVSQAQTNNQQLQLDSNTMAQDIQQIESLMNNNWTVQTVIAGVTLTTVLNTTDQANLIAAYQAQKAKEQADITALP